MLSDTLGLFLATVSAEQLLAGLSEIVEGLGLFRYVFLFVILVFLCFLVHGWRLVGANLCPFDFARALSSEHEAFLRRLAQGNGVDEDAIRKTLFGGLSERRARKNLFFSYLVRFSRSSSQDRRIHPSVENCDPETYVFGLMQMSLRRTNAVSTSLPPLGLLGTLLGMGQAMAKFSQEIADKAALDKTMSLLMKDLSLALYTTLVAVFLKIAADSFCRLTLENEIADARNDLIRLRGILLDHAHESEPQPTSETAEEEPTESGHGQDTEDMVQDDHPQNGQEPKDATAE